MSNKNMTALISCFSRAYHNTDNEYPIYNDLFAKKILTDEEYHDISNSLIQGINFFNKSFQGTTEEALRWIVNNQLSPSVLGRSAFCERSLVNSIHLGTKQYLIFASGYDTSAYMHPNIKSFELDYPSVIDDKILRIEKSKIFNKNTKYIKSDLTKNEWICDLAKNGYDKEKKSFSSLLGISYYLSKLEFIKLLKNISNNIAEGSEIVFDYQDYNESHETKNNELLAESANEQMRSKYKYQEMELLLAESGFLIYELLDYKQMTQEYFENYNKTDGKEKIIAPKGINYCLAVKKT